LSLGRNLVRPPVEKYEFSARGTHVSRLKVCPNTGIAWNSRAAEVENVTTTGNPDSTEAEINL
jgi:hypothetical protein